MSARKQRHRLFDRYNFSIGHAVVGKEQLNVLPAAPFVTAAQQPSTTPEAERRDLEVCAGSVGHQLVMRNAKSVKRPFKWIRKFNAEMERLGPVLDRSGAMLLPGGAHPFLRPDEQTSPSALIPEEVRAVRDGIFDTRSHGWINDQALRLELSFDGDGEFARAHAAVRLLLPLLPALCAASPILEGKSTGSLDSRLDAFLHAHERIPEIMGSLIPEAVFDQDEYYRRILWPIAQALGPHDPGQLLDPQLMNARGATAHFDRSVIAIDLMDAQESASANMAMAEFVVVLLKALVSGRWVSTYLQRAWSDTDLLAILLNTIKEGDRSVISNRDYLVMFGLLKQERMSALKLLQYLFVDLYGELSANARQHIGMVLEHGCLASRIISWTGSRPSHDRIRTAYSELALCCKEDRPFK